MTIRIGVLDRSPVNEGETPVQAIAHTLKLAQKAEELGFYRFWVSEHHGSDVLVGSSPEVLIAHLLAQTSRIRIGSGGVMLQHYSPFKVAENFNLLASLSPGRVDLGVGRGPGGLPLSSKALLPATQGEALPIADKLAQLDQYLNQGGSDGLKAQPLPVTPPALYVLGAGGSSARLAADQGLPYVYAHFLNGDEEVLLQSLAAYREHFKAAGGRKPELIFAVSVLFADTDEDAERLAGDMITYKVHLSSGKTLSIFSLELAERLGQQANEPYTIEAKPASILHGSKTTLAEKLSGLCRKHGIEEVIVLPAAHDFSKRLQAYEWLADGLQLDRPLSYSIGEAIQ
ncbi:LLM class flavin-dependent oxidoreductase [Paenibacillus filicis]|uniref:LLM class flavin-dependent oxidoreductase n=1 Tax=Paenibacillus filicis TaxID=669464 RepID=A0ABU9DPD9_9BACL